MTAAIAQQNDTITPQKKQEKNKEFYKNVKEYSTKNKITKFLHDLFLRSPEVEKSHNSSDKIETELRRDFKKYQGKIIRRIHIRTSDPFGFDEQDTTIVPKKIIDKAGNALHNHTKNFAIRGLLVIKKNQPLDSTKILESERLLRNKRYIRRAFILPKEISKANDSIDLYISVLDNWSLDADGEVSDNWGKLRLREHNIFGFGHRLTGVYKQEFINKKRTAYAIGYNAENIYNTYIDAEAYRNTNFDKTYENHLIINRPFYSQYTRWAGSIIAREQYYFREIYKDELIINPIKTQTFDVWGGFSFPILEGYTSATKRNNLILALRFNRVKYLQTPNNTIDSVSYFSDENLLLSSLSLRNITYTRDRYIFRNGEIEDIAIGNTTFLVSGIQDNQGKLDPYVGLGFIFSKYYDFGYFSANSQWGSYITRGNIRQSVLKLKTTYFTPPFRLGNWYFRQFIKTNFVIGYNRKNFSEDRISLNDGYGIQGFRSKEVFGTRKFIFNFQTQSYVPFSWLGFRISPFVTADFGFIGKETEPFFKNDMYTKFGIGFLISNDYFTFSNVQFSFFYLPYIPGQGHNIYKFSGTRDDEFELQNYEYLPPHIIQYR